MTDSLVLILATDALSAALLGAAIELSGYAPSFPREGEAPRDALRRARPGIVFVDCDHDAATDAAFMGPAIMTGARIAVFGSPRSRAAFRAIANAFGAECFELPISTRELQQVLEACAPLRET